MPASWWAFFRQQTLFCRRKYGTKLLAFHVVSSMLHLLVARLTFVAKALGDFLQLTCVLAHKASPLIFWKTKNTLQLTLSQHNLFSINLLTVPTILIKYKELFTLRENYLLCSIFHFGLKSNHQKRRNIAPVTRNILIRWVNSSAPYEKAIHSESLKPLR